MKDDSNDLELAEVLRWPAPGDRLFVDSDWRLSAHIATFEGERRYRMAKGFKSAGDELVRHAEQSASERPNLVFPIVFCYRHYVELALKSIVEDHGARICIQPIRNSHNLMRDLWPAFIAILTETEVADLNGPDLQAVRTCVEELDVADQRSTAFRYAKDMKGRQPDLPDAIDLFHLRSVMIGVQNFFECVAMALDAHDEERSYGL